MGETPSRATQDSGRFDIRPTLGLGATGGETGWLCSLAPS